MCEKGSILKMENNAAILFIINIKHRMRSIELLRIKRMIQINTIKKTNQ